MSVKVKRYVKVKCHVKVKWLVHVKQGDRQGVPRRRRGTGVLPRDGVKKVKVTLGVRRNRVTVNGCE